MIIGIDGNEANVERSVGVSVYTRELLTRFHSKANSQLQFRVYLKNKPLSTLPEENEFFKYEVIRPLHVWSHFSLPFHFAISAKPDVLFCPAHYTPRFHNIPTVVTIHDLAYKYFPKEFTKEDLYKLEHWTARSIKHASKIICVSNSTRKDLVKFYPQASDKTNVVYNGFRPISPSDTPSKNEYLIKTTSEDESILNIKKHPFILFVGTLQPRKNIKTLIEAFERFSKNHPDFFLLIVGRKGWLYKDIVDRMNSSPAHEKIYRPQGFVSDADLNLFYKHAFATVLPSLYEGFGLPILEAFSNGCDVVASKNSSLPEVGGEAVIYCDPNDPDSIVSAIHSLFSPKIRALLKKNREAQLKKFSWEKCAEETLSTIKSAVKLN